MTQKILIIYSTTDGHTKKICSWIAVALEEKGNEIELVPVNYARPTLLENVDFPELCKRIIRRRTAIEIYSIHDGESFGDA